MLDSESGGNVMKFKSIPVLGILVTMAGCVSFSTPMKNARGDVVNCQNSGFGWLGAPIAAINQKRCESNMRERGFVPPGESPPPATAAAPSTGFSEANSSGAPTAIASKPTVKVSISLPPGWNEMALSEAQVRNGVSISAANPVSEAFIALSARSKANLADLRAFALAMQADQSARVTSTEISVISKIEIAGKPAYAMHVIGTPQGAPQPMRFNMFVIEGASEIALLNIWVPEKIYDSKKQQIDDLLTGLKGLDS